MTSLATGIVSRTYGRVKNGPPSFWKHSPSASTKLALHSMKCEAAMCGGLYYQKYLATTPKKETQVLHGTAIPGSRCFYHVMPSAPTLIRCNSSIATQAQLSGLTTLLDSQQIRSISRYDGKSPGGGRFTGRRTGERQRLPNSQVKPDVEEIPTLEQSPLWSATQEVQSLDAKGSLQRILSNDVLIMTRQIEMMNIFFGFEQANRYAIRNENEEILGYIAEEQRSFFSIMSRQMFRTHRPFRAVIMDPNGAPILWLRRPFAWINSRMFVQHLKNYEDYTPEGEPLLDTFAEVQQRWHLWRRRYDLFLKDTPEPIVSRISEQQPEPNPEEAFHQFARVDNGFLAWTFNLHDARGEEVARISREFRGFGRELFTDTGQYVIDFSPTPYNALEGQPKQTVVRNLTVEERALVLALSVNIDFDYFSRHSESGHWGFPMWWGWSDE